VQTSAIGSGRCIQSRGRDFSFHDFLATDLRGGRDRQSRDGGGEEGGSEGAGGTFVDLFDVFDPRPACRGSTTTFTRPSSDTSAWPSSPAATCFETTAHRPVHRSQGHDRDLRWRGGATPLFPAYKEGADDDHNDDGAVAAIARDHRPRNGWRAWSGSDTRFLQLEMSQVLYSEAEAVANRFRDSFLAAKDLRALRWGNPAWPTSPSTSS
jgi:hypothetical protein